MQLRVGATPSWSQVASRSARPKYSSGGATWSPFVTAHRCRTLLANCRAGTVVFTYGDGKPARAKFPLGVDADTSCASGMPPLVEQFKMLCPAAAKRLKVE